MEGATAEALTSFIEYVENLKDIVKDMGEEAKGMCLALLIRSRRSRFLFILESEG